MTLKHNTKEFSCNKNNQTHLGYLSQLCTNGAYDKLLCIPDLEEQIPFRAGLGVWGLVIVLFGVFGNLLTLLSVPYAAKRQRYPFQNRFVLDVS